MSGYIHLLTVVGLFGVFICTSASDCNGLGTRTADGTCMCNEGFYGKQCECDSFYGLPMEACKKDYKAEQLCSGRGDCLCGICKCSKVPSGVGSYSGTHCECDNYSCPYHRNMICGGNGDCRCGQCVCLKGFSGEDCSFQEGMETCISPDNDQVCNDNGMCVSGTCECNPGYSGSYCESCPTCVDRCGQNKKCAVCSMDDSNDCTDVCGATSVTKVEQLDTDNEKMCLFMMGHDGNLMFTYTINDGKVQISVPKPQTPNQDASKDGTTDSNSSTTSNSSYFVYFSILFRLVSSIFLL